MRLKLALALIDYPGEIIGITLADTLRNFADAIEGMEFSDIENLHGQFLKMETGRNVGIEVTQ